MRDMGCIFTEGINYTGNHYKQGCGKEKKMGDYNRIICIGAHPLDAEIMGGPMMIRYAEKGGKCTFLHVTKGRLTDPAATNAEKQAYEDALNEEIKRAAETMDCECRCLNYTSAEIPPTSDFILLIEDYLRSEQADCVITHARGTLHPRHYYTYECVTAAVQKLRMQGNPIQLYYGENCEDLAGFTPTLYVTMEEEQVKKWFDGLQKYSIFNGKVNDMPYYEYYHSMGKIRAIEAGMHGFVKAYMHGALLDNE